MSIIALVQSLASQSKQMAKQQVVKNVRKAKDNRTQKRDAQEVLERFGDMRADGVLTMDERNSMRTMARGLGFEGEDLAVVNSGWRYTEGDDAGLSMESAKSQQNLALADQIERKFENRVEKFDDEDADLQSKLKLAVSEYQNSQTEENDMLKKEAQARKSIGQAWSQI